MLTLPSATSALLIGALSKKAQPCAALHALLPTACLSATPSLFSSFILTTTAWAPVLPVIDRSGLEQWKTPYKWWARRAPGWGPLTLV